MYLHPNLSCSSPQDLNLTVTNECVLQDNIDVLRKNGFEFSINDSGNNNYVLSNYFLVIIHEFSKHLFYFYRVKRYEQNLDAMVRIKFSWKSERI